MTVSLTRHSGLPRSGKSLSLGPGMTIEFSVSS